MPSIAIIGASNDPQKYGHAAVLAFLRAGWTVFPVHPTEPLVEGQTAFGSVKDVPQPLDWISVYVPSGIGEKLLPQLAEVDAKEIWFNPGSASPELLRMAKAELKYKVVSGCSIRAIGMDPHDFF